MKKITLAEIETGTVLARMTSTDGKQYRAIKGEEGIIPQWFLDERREWVSYDERVYVRLNNAIRFLEKQVTTANEEAAKLAAMKARLAEIRARQAQEREETVMVESQQTTQPVHEESQVQEWEGKLEGEEEKATNEEYRRGLRQYAEWLKCEESYLSLYRLSREKLREDMEWTLANRRKNLLDYKPRYRPCNQAWIEKLEEALHTLREGGAICANQESTAVLKL